jgi:hypothetical protein
MTTAVLRVFVSTSIVALACAFPCEAAAANPVDLRATPTLTGARLRITVKQPGGIAIVRRFATVHERPMHLFVVGAGLDFFAHEYPVQQPDGVFMADVTLPRPGPYMAIVEFLPEGGTPQMFQQAFTTGSAFGRVVRPAVDTAPKIVDGMRVTLDASLAKPGERQPVTLQIDDAATGAPIADREAYLGAAALMVLLPPDLTEAVHEHPAMGAEGAPIVFRPLIPRAGVFKVWIRFQRAGRAATAAFVIDVPQPPR